MSSLSGSEDGTNLVGGMGGDLGIDCRHGLVRFGKPTCTDGERRTGQGNTDPTKIAHDGITPGQIGVNNLDDDALAANAVEIVTANDQTQHSTGQDGTAGCVPYLTKPGNGHYRTARRCVRIADVIADARSEVYPAASRLALSIAIRRRRSSRLINSVR